MLLELKVSNFAIIENVHISFRSGLNILSGETGAGKSVLLKSLSLLMGAKAVSDSVRTGCDTATIEGAFDLSSRKDILKHLAEMGVDISDDSLVVRRVISAQGKSRVYLNGSLSALASLREIVAPLIELTSQTAPLIEMTGQHDNRNLQSKSYHLDLLDSYTGSWTDRKKVSELYSRHKEILEAIDTIESDSRTRAQRLDFLIYQRDEIKALGMNPGEELILEENAKKLKNASRLLEFTKHAESCLYSEEDSVLVKIHKIIQRGIDVAALDKELNGKLENLTQAKALIEECVYELRDYEQSLAAPSTDLHSVEEKMNQLRQLQKKYGASVEEILSTLEEVENEIALIEGSGENLQDLYDEKDSVFKALGTASHKLHTSRKNGAVILSESVNAELQDLNMKGLEFSIEINQMEGFHSNGNSQVEFKTRSTKKDKYRPLAKFASGGELSRILLSLKRVIGKSDLPRTFLFDEVDAGVSGVTAERVGRKLQSIAQGQQVICVTHLPQVASFANAHFYIHKTPSSKNVQMDVVPLTGKKQVEEIARLLSGKKITKTSLDHAQQLLNECSL